MKIIPKSSACCAPGCCEPDPKPAVDVLAADAIRQTVRASYGAIARAEGAPASAAAPSCCAPLAVTDPGLVGYGVEEAAQAPAGANLGLGCGNPQAIAALRPGEVVLDLGSGAGFDCFLAARAVGEAGRVIGVDMTPDMVSRARRLAAENGFPQVEFRLGEIEHLPVADQTVDVILSNCVINLSPDKAAVFRDCFRVLRPGGRLAIADVVAKRPLDPAHAADLALLVGCIAGASTVAEVEGWLAAAGFVDIAIGEKPGSAALIACWAPGHPAVGDVMSATIAARRP